jgi:hypothetical protein
VCECASVRGGDSCQICGYHGTTCPAGLTCKSTGEGVAGCCEEPTPKPKCPEGLFYVQFPKDALHNMYACWANSQSLWQVIEATENTDGHRCVADGTLIYYVCEGSEGAKAYRCDNYFQQDKVPTVLCLKAPTDAEEPMRVLV